MTLRQRSESHSVARWRNQKRAMGMVVDDGAMMVVVAELQRVLSGSVVPVGGAR